MSKKSDILRVTTTLFAHKGFPATSMGEVSRISGVAPATIFYHFKTKEDLFLAVLEAARDDIVRRINAHLAENDAADGLQRVKNAVTFYLRLAGEIEDRFLLLHHRSLYELAGGNAAFERHLEETVSSLVDLFHAAIVRGQQDGSIAPLPAHKTALIIFSMVDGIVRLKTHRLYSAGSLHDELLDACERMLRPPTGTSAP